LDSHLIIEVPAFREVTQLMVQLTQNRYFRIVQTVFSIERGLKDFENIINNIQ